MIESRLLLAAFICPPGYVIHDGEIHEFSPAGGRGGTGVGQGPQLIAGRTGPRFTNISGKAGAARSGNGGSAEAFKQAELWTVLYLVDARSHGVSVWPVICALNSPGNHNCY